MRSLKCAAFKLKATTKENFMILMLVISMSSFMGIHCGFLQFEDFYSQSFVPNGLIISYRIEDNISIYYNFTALMSFPGKILFSIFVRKVGNKSGERSQNMLKYKNLDFCKTIDSMKNFTTENFHSDTLLQSTFLNSCPLQKGFYYIANGTVNDDVVPLYFTSGLYWIQIELVQVFGEVTKMMNVKVKCAHENKW